MSKLEDKGRDDSRPPLLVAQEWLTQITTVVLEMLLPGLAGQWLDHRWGTKFLTLVGFALGLTVGIWHLIAMTRPKTSATGQDQSSGQNQIAGNDQSNGDDQQRGKDQT